jgi:single-strand DNA-binding protein
MTDLNNTVLIGRLTSGVGEKDFGYISTGTAKLTIHMANNKSRKQGEEWIDETSFFDVVVWGKLAEYNKPKIEKGATVVVSGRLTQDRWKDCNGQIKSKIYIVADVLEVYNKIPSNVQKVAEAFDNPQNVPQNVPQGVPQNVTYAPQNVTYAPQNAPEQNGGFPEDIPYGN